MSNKPLSEEEVRNVILEWGRLWDEHAPIADFLPLVAEEVLKKIDSTMVMGNNKSYHYQ